MRAAVIRTLIELAERDSRVALLTGDLGFMVVEPFAERFPDRFWNVGVAEQEMVGIATGLAEAGFIPFTYSIATFSALRPYEFVRNGPVLHQLQVRVLAVGGGFEYGSAGPTHHALEDIAVMRALPGLTVLAPADFGQAAAAVRATWDIPGPVYFRLGKNDKALVAGLDGRFSLGRAEVIRRGSARLVIAALGAVARDAAEAAEVLATEGIECTLVVVASVSPAPEQDLVDLLSDAQVAVTVEAHSITGGLGSLVSEVVAEHGLRVRVVRCGVRSCPDGVGGSEAFMNARHGLDAGSIAATARRALGLVPVGAVGRWPA